MGRKPICSAPSWGLQRGLVGADTQQTPMEGPRPGLSLTLPIAVTQFPPVLCPSPTLSLPSYDSHSLDELLCILHDSIQMASSVEPFPVAGLCCPYGSWGGSSVSLQDTNMALSRPAVTESEWPGREFSRRTVHKQPGPADSQCFLL